MSRIRRLFADTSLKLEFGDNWFNAPSRPLARGVLEGVGLEAVLGTAARGLPWNLAFEGRNVVTRPDLFVKLARKRGEPQITLVSPTPDSLVNLYRVCEKTLPNIKTPSEPEPIDMPTTRGALDIDAVAGLPTPEDGAPANGSSIALLLEHGGAPALLTADAFPSVLQHALAALATSRRQQLPWTLDFIKFSHHGSRKNTTNSLLETVSARHFLVSTNRAIFGHPDQEAIARVIASGNPGGQVSFNFRTPRTVIWASKQLRA